MKHLILSILVFSSLWASGQIEHLLISSSTFPQNQSFSLDDPLHSFNTTTSVEPIIKKPIVIEGDISHAILKTSNGCGIGNFIIPSTGDPAQGIPPTIGSIYSNSPLIYRDLDTIPGTQIKGVAFTRQGYLENSSIIETGDPYVVISDSGMFSYWIPDDYSPYENSITKIDSIYIPNIKKVATQITTAKTNPIVLFVEDSTNNNSLRFYQYPGLQELFSFAFYFEPEIFEVVDSALFITGQDTSGNYLLYHFSALQDTLYATFTLNNLASNAQEFLVVNDSMFILSSPGDSIITLTTINRLDSTITQAVVYQNSGARATHNAFKGDKLFTCQPISDTPDSVLNKQILILNPVNNDLDTFLINLELDVFKHPQQAWAGFGFFDLEWIGAKWDNGYLDTVYIKQSWDLYKLGTGAFPRYINATHGCWISVPNNEPNKIKFKLYPNPASTDVTIQLSGLEKGRQYQLNVVGVYGKVQYTTSLMAYQEIKIPLYMLAKGVYFLKLDTGRNIITQKLIIQ